jgi:hypothetical protein
MRELQMWCPTPLPEGEQHRRKLRSDKCRPPAGHLLEFYESDSSVEAYEDTGDEAACGDAGGVAKARCRTTRSAVAKKSASAGAAAVSAVKATEKEEDGGLPSDGCHSSIPTPRSREVESEEEEESEKEKDEAVEELSVPKDQAVRGPESPAAKRQRVLMQKTSEDALQRGLEAQRSAAAA